MKVVHNKAVQKSCWWPAASHTCRARRHRTCPTLNAQLDRPAHESRGQAHGVTCGTCMAAVQEVNWRWDCTTRVSPQATPPPNHVTPACPAQPAPHATAPPEDTLGAASPPEHFGLRTRYCPHGEKRRIVGSGASKPVTCQAKGGERGVRRRV